MTIWIDPPRWPAHERLWSHLISDESYAELHTFAGAVGIPRGAFEGDHYDVPQERYAALLAAGAAPTSGKEVARRLRDGGLRFAKRKGERPLARFEDVMSWVGAPHRVDVAASPLPTPDELTNAAAVLVSDADRRILLVHTTSRRTWGPPAGGREQGESVLEAAVRETLEESGVRLDPDRLRACGWWRTEVAQPVGSLTHRRNYAAVFAAHLTRAAPDVAPRADDVDAAAWVSLQEAERRCGEDFWWPLLEHVVQRAVT